MSRYPSLARRVTGFLVAAQLFAFVIGGAATMALELGKIAYFRLSRDELAQYRVSNLVIDSLARGAGGSIRIEPANGLRDEMKRSPRLKYAAFDEARRPLAGSSPELVDALTKAGVVQMTQAHIHFNLPGDEETTPLGYMERRATPFGRLHIAVYRQTFRWDDVFGYFLDAVSWQAAYLAAFALASIGAAWFAVRRGLAPLCAAAREMESIDIDCLNRRIEITEAPREIKPFVDAINAALMRLEASAKRMRRYTANAAHQLRTPLAIMRARLDDPEEPTFKSDLQRDASTLQAIVEQMLIAAQLTERQASLDEEVDLATTVRRVVSDYAPLIIECDRKIEFEAPDGAISVRGNQRAIECVVSNLIDNALRAEPVGGGVLVRVGPGATVSVVDHGKGVAPSDREMIFEAFWRKSEAAPGTGLGLAIAKELMEKMKGRIWVEDTTGGGATFKLGFPVLNPKSQHESKEQEPRITTSQEDQTSNSIVKSGVFDRGDRR